MPAPNRLTSSRTPTRIGLMIVTLFLAVAVTIVGVVVVHEHSLAVHQQTLLDARQTDIPALQKELRARESAMLETVKAIDSSAGVYRIPIERAMELIAREGNR
jgi:hypothetical protein